MNPITKHQWEIHQAYDQAYVRQGCKINPTALVMGKHRETIRETVATVEKKLREGLKPPKKGGNMLVQAERTEIKLTRYELERIYKQDVRKYVCPDDKIRAGITSILSKTKSQDEIEGLAKWRKRVGAEEAQRVTDTACSRGTATHSVIESYLRGEKFTISEEAEPYWYSIQPVVEQVKPVLIEGAVWHSMGYAGTLDCLGYYEGKLQLLDWKTAKAPKKIEWVQGYFMQAAAYIGAVNELYGLSVEDAVIAIAIPYMPCQVFELDGAVIDYYWQQWQERVKRFLMNHGR